MSRKKRTSVEQALEIVLDILEIDKPVTVGEIATKTDLSWAVVDRAITLAMSLQDYLRAYKITVLGGKGSKVILIELKVDLTRLPKPIREWFIEEKFFKGEDKKQYSTEQVRELLKRDREESERTTLEDSIRLVLDALALEDELSVLEVSKRTDLNRRTVERVLDVLQQIGERFDNSILSNVDNTIIKRKFSDIYALDETRLEYLLKKWYLPHLVQDISEEKERVLLQMS